MFVCFKCLDQGIYRGGMANSRNKRIQLLMIFSMKFDHRKWSNFINLDASNSRSMNLDVCNARII